MTELPSGALGSRAASYFRSARQVLAPLVVPTLPSEVPFGVLGQILPPRDPVQAHLEFHRVPDPEAKELLDRVSATAEAELLRTGAGASAIERAQAERTVLAAREVARRVSSREQELWGVGIGFAGSGATNSRAERLRGELRRRLGCLGFATRVPYFRAAGTFPRLVDPKGGDRPPGYWHTLPTDGLAAFFPFVDESVVDPEGVLVGLLLDDASPVIIDRWSHASHSWGVFGTTGSGKSFTATLLATRSTWRDPTLEVIVIDPLGEFVPWCAAMDGVVLALASKAGVRLNPLDPSTTEGDRVEKAARVVGLLRTLFPSLRDEEGAALDSAVHRLYAEGPRVPEFSDLASVVDRLGSAAGRLPQFFDVLTSGSLAHLDGPTTARFEGSPLVVTLTGVAPEHLPFHLSYVLDAIQGRVRRADHRRLIILDEAHLLMRDRNTAEFLDGMTRVMRHYQAGLIAVSQHPEDFLATEPGRSILRNLRAVLLLRMTSLSREAIDFFHLTPSEAAWLPRARLPKEAGYAEALLRLGPAHLPIAIVASTPEFEFLTRVPSGKVPGPGRPRTDAPPTATLSAPERRENADGGRDRPPSTGSPSSA